MNTIVYSKPCPNQHRRDFTQSEIVELFKPIPIPLKEPSEEYKPESVAIYCKDPGCAYYKTPFKLHRKEVERYLA